MKKKNSAIINNKYIIIICSIVAIITIIINIFYVKNNYITNDEKKFRFEYERFNNRNNLSKLKYTTIHVEKRNRIKYLSSMEVVNLLKSGTGVIYFGYPESFACRSIVEPLLSAISKENVKKLYYLNGYDIRDEKMKLESGEIIATKKADKNYSKILDLFGDYAEEYNGFENENLKRLYLPTVVFVKKGKIIDFYSGTLDNVDVSKILSEENKNKLEDMYTKAIRKMYK